jgi:DNA-binding XRE family transcriptional regulator
MTGDNVLQFAASDADKLARFLNGDIQAFGLPEARGGGDGGAVVKTYRSLMQERLGRPFLDDEVVHHIDGDRANNGEHNLALMTRRAHARLHARERKLAVTIDLELTKAPMAPIDLAQLEQKLQSGPRYYLRGSDIKAIREALHWTEADLAYCAGVAAQTIRRVETQPDQLTSRARIAAQIQVAFESAGVDFRRGPAPPA